LDAHLDLVAPRPAFELIETDPADPGTGAPVERRPRAEPVHLPRAQARFGERCDALGRQVSLAPNGGILKQPLKLGAVFLAPRPQDQALRLDPGGARRRPLPRASASPRRSG